MAGGARRSVPISPKTTETEPRAKPGGPPPAPATGGTENPAGCALRLYWMGLGNFALVIGAVLAARRAAPSALDAVYALVVASLIAARFVDITRFGGQTTEGDPASLAHWRRHAAVLVPVAAALWWLARLAHARGWF